MPKASASAANEFFLDEETQGIDDEGRIALP